MLKSILCLPSLPEETVNVGGKIVFIDPPASASSSGIASGPSISTQISPPSLDH